MVSISKVISAPKAALPQAGFKSAEHGQQEGIMVKILVADSISKEGLDILDRARADLDINLGLKPE